MTNVKIFFSIIGLLILGGITMVVMDSKSANSPSTLNKYDGFAQCLKDKGATFYGAFWCPHCKAQKKLFGSSVKLLPYVECSTPDGNSQTAECIAKKIESYPTWIFADGTQETGEVPLAKLAEKTSCVLPE
jgi:thiol-disulfide isomerase/thioredoxin